MHCCCALARAASSSSPDTSGGESHQLVVWRRSAPRSLWRSFARVNLHAQNQAERRREVLRLAGEAGARCVRSPPPWGVGLRAQDPQRPETSAPAVEVAEAVSGGGGGGGGGREDRWRAQLVPRVTGDRKAERQLHREKARDAHREESYARRT